IRAHYGRLEEGIRSGRCSTGRRPEPRHPRRRNRRDNAAQRQLELPQGSTLAPWAKVETIRVEKPRLRARPARALETAKIWPRNNRLRPGSNVWDTLAASNAWCR